MPDFATDNPQLLGELKEHPLFLMIHEIDSSHFGLGNLAAACLVAAKVEKMLLIVGPRGTGKSTVVEWLESIIPDSIRRDDLTVASLGPYNEQFTGFRSTILIEDLGRASGLYHRVQTCMLLAELCYSHFMIKDSMQVKVDIDDFHGSVVATIQPGILAELVKDITWHSNLADKTIRYYHLRRPLIPTEESISAVPPEPVPIEEVNRWDGESPLWEMLYEIGIEHWSRARASQHIHALARAVAAYGSSYQVREVDLLLLLDLLRPLSIEMDIIERNGFESQATLNQNLLYLLVEFATYPAVTYKHFEDDYQMRNRKVQQILGDMHDWYAKSGNNPVTLVPTQQLLDILKRAGIR